MKVSAHISNSLTKHDCVIIPQFGAFIKQAKSAKILAEAEKIRPPYSAIIFNETLQQSDGILVNEIVSNENITEQNAQQKINNFVHTASQSLKDKKLFRIEGIGKLYENKDGDIAFKVDETINFTKESYGLPILGAKIISRAKQERENIKKSISKRKEKLSPITAFFTVAASVLALLMAGSLYLLNEGSETEQQLIRNTFGPFVLANVNMNSSTSISSKNIETANFTDELNNKNELTGSAGNKNDPFAESADKKTTLNANNIADFHVVVGMFTKEHNAKIVEAEAISKGYQATIKKGRKYYRIVIPFSNENASWVEAQKQLAKDITSDAWIWESRLK